MTITPYLDFIRSLWKRQEGQTMAEYGVVLALITLAVVGTITLLGTQIDTKLTDVLHALGG